MDRGERARPRITRQKIITLIRIKRVAHTEVVVVPEGLVDRATPIRVRSFKGPLHACGLL
jgi:hypothetical protein